MKHSKIFFCMVLFVLMCSTVLASSPDLQVSLLNQDPNPAKAGDVIELRLRVQNTGDAEAKNVLFEAVPEYPFTLLAGTQKQQVIDSLPNYPDKDSATTLAFKFRVDRDVTQGQYEIKFRHSLNKGTAWFMHDFNADLTSREFAQIFSIDKIKIMPGKETDLTFTVTNVGNAPLQNLMFFWKETNGIILPVGTDNTRYIKYLEPGASIPMAYKVIASVNAKPDLYTLSLNLQYDSPSTAKNGTIAKETITTTAGVFVGGETDFDVAFSESTAGQTSLSVANVGSNPAYSVTVRVPQQGGFSVRGTTDAIIGNLDKGDYTVVSFQITPNGIQGINAQRTDTENNVPSSEQIQQFRQQRAAQGSQRNISSFASTLNNLKVSIDYTDTTGVRHTIQKTVSIQFRASDGTTLSANGFSRTGRTSTAASSWLSNTYLWLAIIVIAAGIVLYKKPQLRQKLINLVEKKK